MIAKSYNILQVLSPLTFRTFRLRVPSTTTPTFSLVLSKHFHSSFVVRIRKMSSSTSSTGEIPESVQFQSTVLEQPAQLAKEVFKEAVESVKPPTLMKKRIRLESSSVLQIDDEKGTSVQLSEFKRIFVVGFGKAVLPMAEEILSILDNKVNRCIVNIPEGFRDSENKAIEINRGARNNIPDENAYFGAQKIVDLVQSCQPDDLLIVLISGGGSALLPYPLPPITIQEKSSLIKALSTAGASIQELNTVRKRLSLVKGGGLLGMCKSSRIISLILSDVLGDPLDIIASGPTVLNTDPGHLAKQIVEKYTSFQDLPEDIKKILDDRKPSPSFPNSLVTNTIIGNNSIALETAAKTAKDLNLYPFIITNTLSGEASVVGDDLGHMASTISYLFRCDKADKNFNVYVKAVKNLGKKLGLDDSKMTELIDRVVDEEIREGNDGICLLMGGETTVHVQGTGVGGRNQELALTAAIKIDTSANNSHVRGKVAVLSAGTDGFDGPCDAAGAAIDSSTVMNGYPDKLSAFDYLSQNNSYNYFKANSNGAYHIITGHTETNVMDLMILVVLK